MKIYYRDRCSYDNSRVGYDAPSFDYQTEPFLDSNGKEVYSKSVTVDDRLTEKEAMDVFYEAICLIVNHGKGLLEGIRIAEKEMLKKKGIEI